MIFAAQAALSRSSPAWHNRRELIWFAVLALALLGIGMGLRDPWPADEPRFALVAHWMVHNGQWLFPHRGSELYSDKPPLFFWLQAVSYLVTRHWRVAFLLPSLVSGLVTLALVYDLGRRLWSHRAGLLAALTLLVTIQFTFEFRRAQIDPVLVGIMTAANYGLLRHFLLGPSRKWLAVGCFCAGLGVITKGVGFLSLLMFVPYCFARWRHWHYLASPARARWRWLAYGSGLFLLPILAWLVPMLVVARMDGDPAHAAYVRDILLGQTVHRYVAPSAHFHSAAYFLGIICTDWLPLAFALPWAIPAWWTRLRRRHDARYLILLGWAFLVIVFFSLSPGKRAVYILPTLPMVALAMAPVLNRLVYRRGPLILTGALTMLVALALTTIGLAAILWHPAWTLHLRGMQSARLWDFIAVIGIAGLAITACTRIRHAALGWVLFVSVLWPVYGLWGYPLLNGTRSARTVMQAARAAAGPGKTIGLVAWRERNLLMLKGPAKDFGFLQSWDSQYEQAIAWLLADPAKRRVFIRQEAMGRCIRRNLATHLGHGDGFQWWLFGADAVVAGCQPPNGYSAR